MTRARWRAVCLWALLGWGIGVALALANLASTHDSLGGLVDSGPEGPAAAVIAADLPEEPMLAGGEHDGPMFYAVARDPLHLDEAARHLDRPRYRLQRIAFPFASWLLHPTGGGQGLVWTMFAVNAAGVLAGAVATGVLAERLGGRGWVAVTLPVFFGSIISLRITTPDPLALALALWAVVLSLDGRTRFAVLCGCAAVLTREPVWLVLAGFAIWRRDRPGWWIALGPAAAGVVWWAWLRFQPLPSGTQSDIIEFTYPFRGWVDAVRFWSQGYEELGLISFAAGVIMAIIALARRGLAHPLGWAVLLNLAMVVVLQASPIAAERNASRTMLPLMVLAMIMLVTPDTAAWRSSVRARGMAAVGG